MGEMKIRRNIFWINKDINLYYEEIDLSTMKFEEAVKKVSRCEDIKYCYFESINSINTFKYIKNFVWNGNLYIIKLRSKEKACIERNNAMRVKCLLGDKYCGLLKLNIVVPEIIFDEDNAILITQYYGLALNDQNDISIFDQAKLRNLFNLFNEKGIEWRGMLPKNMLLNKQGLHLIDWEDVVFYENKNSEISDLAMLKFSIAWSNFYKLSLCKDTKKLIGKVVKSYEDELDFFEAQYAMLVDKNFNEVRKECSENTIDSESYIDIQEQCVITPYLLGHFIDENYHVLLSIMYTFGTSLFKKKYGEDIYRNFMHAVENIMKKAHKISYKTNKKIFDDNILDELMVIIISLLSDFDVSNLNKLIHSDSYIEINYELRKSSRFFDNYILIKNLRAASGIENSYLRAESYQNITHIIFSFIKAIFKYDDSIEMLIRGSCAQGITTVKSDIDFEVSSLKKKEGHRSIENLIGEIFGICGIKCEGSDQRPLERDLQFTDNHYRDLHEYYELCIPKSKIQNKGWLQNITPIESVEFYSELSLYELSLECTEIKSKSIFFLVRDLILKLALKNNIYDTNIKTKLYRLQTHISSKDLREINELLSKSVIIYENDIKDEKIIEEILLRISNISTEYNIVLPNNLKLGRRELVYGLFN